MSEPTQTAAEPTQATTATEVETRTFSVSTAVRFTLENIRGSIDVRPGEPGQIVVTAVKHGDNGSARDTKVEMTQSDDGSVWVKTHYPHNGWSFLNFNRPCRVDYTVLVPAQSTVKVSGVSCSAAVQGIHGAVDLATVSGPLSLQAISGPLKINSVSGSVAGEQLTGSLRLETVSGSVRLEESSFSSITAATVSGSLEFQTDLAEGPYRLNSVSGDVRLLLPPDACCSIHSHTISGRVLGASNITRRREQGGNRFYEIGGGGVAVNFNSISGNLRLEGGAESQATPAAEASPAAEAQAAAPVPPAAPAAAAPPPTAPLSRLEVLDRIAKGELSVEEALRLME